MTLEEYAAKQAGKLEEPKPKDTQRRNPLEVEQVAQRTAQAQAVEVYKEHQENIRKVGQLNTEILKGIHNGENLANLFLKAVKAMTLCTGNKAEYDIIESTLLSVYGAGLHEKEVVSISIDAVQNRLDRLKKALTEVTDRNEQSRIEQAIQVHQKQLEQLKK
ncbi:MAG: hypothetical protein NC205_03360 [Prevotella sp.]|nr:hypothetical protein [Prevotella sp.]MCM1473382.1 hypothetical protein [Muribaculaceae bacterium]